MFVINIDIVVEFLLQFQINSTNLPWLADAAPILWTKLTIITMFSQHPPYLCTSNWCVFQFFNGRLISYSPLALSPVGNLVVDHVFLSVCLSETHILVTAGRNFFTLDMLILWYNRPTDIIFCCQKIVPIL